jgi:surfactin family lipopeptide synthetase A
MYRIRLSPHHKIFYLEWLIMPENAYYNMLIDQMIYGNLDVERLKGAIRRYVSDHVLINSHVKLIGDEPYWVKNSNIDSLDYSSLPATDSEILDFVNKSFNLYNGTLYRFKLIRLCDNQYRLITVFHHLVIDALSGNDGFMRALSNYYNDKNYTTKYSINSQIDLISDLTNSLYENFDDNKIKCELFWNSAIKAAEGVDLKFLDFTKDKTNNNLSGKYNTTQKVRFQFSSEIVSRLNSLKRKFRITPYFYGQNIYALLLYKYTHQEKFIIGSPVAIKEGVDFIYGAQVNTCLIPYQLSDEMSIIDVFNQSKIFLKSLKHEGINYSYYPISNILSHNNNYLLNAMFNQANFKQLAFNFDGIEKIEVLDNYNMYLHGSLMFEQELKDNILYYQVRFDKNIIDEDLLDSFIENYKRLFIEILVNLENGLTNKSIKNYSLLTTQEYHKIVYELNNLSKPYPNHTINRLFEEQVLKTPNKIAVIFDDVYMSYSELNENSNKLAHHLTSRYGVKPNNLIALYLERSEHMIISILAILKTGCAYVPLDTTHPCNRLEYILKETNINLILTNQLNKKHLEGIKANLEIIDSDETQTILRTVKSTNLNISGDLAYVMYTSGTTSNPKGVAMPHKSCVNRILEMNQISGITLDDKILFKTNYVFDVSFSDIFTGLFSGASIVITKNIFDVNEIHEKIIKHAITICHFTPSQFDTIRSVYGDQTIVNLRVINFSGEPLEQHLLIRISNKVKCINYYGPTETGEVTAEIISSNHNLARQPITIGNRFHNTQLFIVDKNLSPLPYGVIGELCIGGECIASGYVNQPQLTAEKFIDNNFQTEDEKKLNKNSKLYKTGDMVRLLPNNNIEYIGRTDRQVKINGYRVELGEIENKISEYPGMKQVVVQIFNISSTKTSYLVAYYVSEAEVEIDQNNIEDYLSTILPANYIPKKFIKLKNIPLTTNGKLDTGSLPEPDIIIKDKYVTPNNELEKKICDIYTKVLSLGSNTVGMKHDFFSCGGNSLLLIKLVAQLQQEFNVIIDDINRLHTPEKALQFLLSIKVNLPDKTEQIKQICEKISYLQQDINIYEPDLLSKYNNYLKNIKKNHFTKKNKNIRNVLLTGATGYLGCNILQKLLDETDYTIYLLVRATSTEDAYDRVNTKFLSYFGQQLDNYNNRIIILESKLDQLNMGVQDHKYEKLINNIDSIIHCAALVKHDGEYSDFYKSNIITTINLLELAKATKNKDFHHISTIGILIGGSIPKNKSYIIDENDDLSSLEYKVNSNFYLYSKYEAELLLPQYKKFGVKINIYRIGNQGTHSIKHFFQENATDNLCFSQLKTIISLGIIAPEINHIEISPVDITAQAIVKIFDRVALSNKIYHLFNPYMCNLTAIFATNPKIKIKTKSLEEFVTNMFDKIHTEQISETNILILYRMWLKELDNLDNITRIKICQEQTNYILEKLGVYWPRITMDMFGTTLE